MTDALVVTLVVGAIGVAVGVTFVAFVSWRVVRRLRALRTRMRSALPAGIQIPGPEAAATVWTHLHRRLFDMRVVTSTGSKRQALMLRRQLWQHVDAASAAVSQAQAADAPLGDLPRLIREIGHLARHHDRQLALLSHDFSGINVETARAQVDQIIGCADDIALATLESLGSVPTRNADHMRFVIGQETQAVRAGSAQLRSISVPGG